MLPVLPRNSVKDLQDKEETSLMEGSQSDGKAEPLTLGEAWQRHISCLRCPDGMASLVEVPVGCRDRCQEAMMSRQTYPPITQAKSQVRGKVLPCRGPQAAGRGPVLGLFGGTLVRSWGRSHSLCSLLAHHCWMDLGVEIEVQGGLVCQDSRKVTL